VDQYLTGVPVDQQVHRDAGLRKQRPKFGTAANIIVLAYSSDLGLSRPQPLGLPARVGLLVGGILLNGFSVAAYVGARLGPGPRDGLMTGDSATGAPSGSSAP
jgi:uncharacterized membrane protein YczE